MHHAIAVAEPMADPRLRRGGGDLAAAAAEGGYKLSYVLRGTEQTRPFDAGSDRQAIIEAARFLKVPTGEFGTPRFETLFRRAGGRWVVRIADNVKIYPRQTH